MGWLRLADFEFEVVIVATAVNRLYGVMLLKPDKTLSTEPSA
jgi:hypothetical protein